MWTVIVLIYTHRLAQVSRQRGYTGLGAVAGGWAALLSMPLVVVLLTVAFGIGVSLIARPRF
jgi:hypothetical protein